MADITIRSPFRELNARLNHLLDDAWLRSITPADWDEGTLAIDVSEDDNEIKVRASLPGFDEKEIEVQLDAGMLSITARHEESHEEKNEQYFRRERYVGAVSRRVALPGATASTSDVRAELEKGVLTVHVPRAEEAKPKKIEIKAGG